MSPLTLVGERSKTVATHHANYQHFSRLLQLVVLDSFTGLQLLDPFLMPTPEVLDVVKLLLVVVQVQQLATKSAYFGLLHIDVVTKRDGFFLQLLLAGVRV